MKKLPHTSDKRSKKTPETEKALINYKKQSLKKQREHKAEIAALKDEINALSGKRTGVNHLQIEK